MTVPIAALLIAGASHTPKGSATNKVFLQTSYWFLISE
jgi:hypothetical protein